MEKATQIYLSCRYDLQWILHAHKIAWYANIYPQSKYLHMFIVDILKSSAEPSPKLHTCSSFKIWIEKGGLSEPSKHPLPTPLNHSEEYIFASVTNEYGEA